MTITLDRRDEICNILTEAGENWETVAQTIPELGEIFPATATTRLYIELPGEVESSLYGITVIDCKIHQEPTSKKWFATGWTDDSRMRIHYTHRAVIADISTPADERGEWY